LDHDLQALTDGLLVLQDYKNYIEKQDVKGKLHFLTTFLVYNMIIKDALALASPKYLYA
jgi:hypothetical protein